MKDDDGNEWTKKDYLMMIIIIPLILIAICIPAAILIGFDWITGWKYHWPAFWILFIGLFIYNIWTTLKPKHKLSTDKNI